MLKYTKLNIDKLEDRETPSYSASIGSNIKVGGVFDASSSNFIILQEYSYLPFDGFDGNLNSVFIEDGELSAVAPEKNGGPRVQINQIDFINQNKIKLFDDFVFEESFNGGVNLAMTDVNSDGLYDLIVGPNIGGGPRLRVLSGADNFNTVLYDNFVYGETYRGGIEVGAFNGKLVTLAKFGGGPHLRILDISTNTSTDFFVGDSESRTERKLLYGDLLGVRQNYVANYENNILYLYDLNGKLLTKNVIPYTVYSIGVGGNAFSENNRIMIVGLLNSPYIDNNNGNELIEYDAVLNKSLGSLPFTSNAFLGVAVNKSNRFDDLFENGFLGVEIDEIVPKPLASRYDFVSPYRANLGIVYGGTTIGNHIGTGTFTVTVKDKLTNEIYGLTNSHVAHEGSVFSPGLADLREVFLGGLFIGDVVRTSGISFTSVNYIDSSLFNTAYDKDISENILVDVDINRKPITIRATGKTTVTKGDLVYGFGRTSGARPGIVQDTSKGVSVQYDDGVANFDDQLYILSSTMPFGFASHGDSGSIVMKPEFVGDGTIRWMVTSQIFAGNSIFGIASKWQHIEDIMGVQLV